MKHLISFLALVIAGCVQGTVPRFPFPFDEDSNYDNICANQNVTINFSGLRIEKIKENFISSPIINCLDLSDNSVTSIDFNGFANLPNLKYLNMSDNSINLNDIFSNSHLNLETLILDRADRSNSYTVNFNMIYPKLKRLFMRYNSKNIHFYSSLKNVFPSLTHLYLTGSGISSNSLTWLPKSLEYLDVSGHNLYQLTLENLNNLEYLIVSEPAFKYKLNTIYLNNLKNLKYLSAFSNRLESVMYHTFANLNSLVFLDMSDNNVRFVQTGSLDHMKNLQFLNLSSNYIEVIQGGTFDHLQNLDTLILEKNLIHEYPMISREVKIRFLYLNCNRLRSVAGGTFLKMPHLEALYLHDNEISFIDHDAFVGLENLKTLTLSNNLLSSMPFDWMLPMVSIQDLDLQGNLFQDFANLALSDSSPVENLYLSGQLKLIRSKSLDNIPENVTISVDSDYVFAEKCTKSTEKYVQRFG